MPTGLRLPSGSITDREVSNVDTDQIGPSKLWHLFEETTRFGMLVTEVSPVTGEFILFTANSAGTILSVEAGLWDCGTDADVQFDLKKNGDTVLTGTILQTDVGTDKARLPGTLVADPSYVEDDIFTAVLSGTNVDGDGPFLTVRRKEMGD